MTSSAREVATALGTAWRLGPGFLTSCPLMAEHPARGPSLRLIEHDSQIAVRCDSHSNESARVIEAIRTRWSNLDIVEAPLDALHPPDDFDDNDGWPVGPPPIHESYEALGLPFEDDSDEVADADQYMVVDGVRTLIPTDAEVAAQGADARARGLLTLREAIARWNLENPGGNPIGIDDLDADDRANLDIRAYFPRGGPEGVPCEVYADAAHALLPTATHEEVIAAAQVRLAQARATQKRNESPAIPPRFRLTKETLYASREIKTKDGSRVEESQVCSRLEVAALTRDANSGEWGRLLQFDDPDGVGHEWAMPMSLLAAGGDEYRAALLEQGLRIYPGLNAKNDLHEYLAECRPAARGRAVTRMGWHGGVFVLPNATFGPLSNGERVLFQSASLVSHAFHVCGSLGDWQREIGMRCSGNSRLTFAVSAGFASPLLYLLGDESGGFHFVGPSSLGKTTALRGGGSVWGGSKEPMGFLRQWRATLNGLEGVAASHCDSLLPLDELSQVDAREAGGAAYLLANGSGKSRARRDGSARSPFTWRLLFLSSGEITIGDKIKEDGRQRATAGQAVRVLDIPADTGKFGLFENLHGAASGQIFADTLRAATQQFFGTPIRAFLPEITAHADRIADAARGARDEFIAQNLPAGRPSKWAARPLDSDWSQPAVS